jgi:hypothetical protein
MHVLYIGQIPVSHLQGCCPIIHAVRATPPHTDLITPFFSLRVNCLVGLVPLVRDGKRTARTELAEKVSEF